MENIAIRESFGKVIKQRREEKGVSLTDFARMLGIGKDRLLKIEKGQRPVNVEVLISIAKALNASIDELLGLSRTGKDRAILVGFNQVKIVTACGVFEVCSEEIKIFF